MPWGNWVATINPSQHRKPMKAPVATVLAPDQTTKWTRTNATNRSPTKEEIIPVARPFLGPLGTMPSAAIQGLANRAGEYQTAPSSHRIKADTSTAQWLKWCRWWKLETCIYSPAWR